MNDRPSAAVGLIVPPANPTLEVEIHELTGQSPYVYTSRLPWFPGEDLASRNALYLDAYLDTALRQPAIGRNPGGLYWFQLPAWAGGRSTSLCRSQP